MILFTVQCSECEKVSSTSVSTNHIQVTPKVGTSSYLRGGGGGGHGLYNYTLSKNIFIREKA